MKLKIKKGKLPATLAYPLNSSFLEQIILDSSFNVAKIEYVEYFPEKGPEHLFEAHFKGEKTKAFANPGTISIAINAVPLTIYERVKSELAPLLENNFKQWLNILHENKNNLSDESGGFHVWIRNNKMVVDSGNR